MVVTFRGVPTSDDEFLCCLFSGGVIVLLNIIWIAIDQFPHWTFLVSEAANGNENDMRENPIATGVAAAIFSIPMLCIMCCGVVVLPQSIFANKRLAYICVFCALDILLLVDTVILFCAVEAEPCYVLLALASTLSILPLATAIVRHTQMAIFPEDGKQQEAAKINPEEDIEQLAITNNLEANASFVEVETNQLAGDEKDAIKAIEEVETNEPDEESNPVDEVECIERAGEESIMSATLPNVIITHPQEGNV